MLSFECIKNEKSVYFLLTSAFSGKFMMISYFFGVFRVFASVNFLYAQPIVF